MVFGGTAARSSAIPTPSEGMTSYRTDTQQIESYDGAAWRGMSGLQLVKKQTIGTGVTTVNVTEAFSSVYENYRIIVNGGTANAAFALHLQLGATTSGYRYSYIFNQTSSSTVLGGASESGTFFSDVGRAAGGNGFNLSCDLFSPNVANATGIRYNGCDLASSSGFNINGQGNLPNTTQYTDFTILTASGGQLTGGKIYVYGYGI